MPDLVCSTADRDAWLTARRSGITATDIVTIKRCCARCGYWWPYPAGPILYLPEYGWLCSDLDGCQVREACRG